MNRILPTDQNNKNEQLVFFKDFISMEPPSSIAPNLMFEKKIQKPQRSHIAFKSVLNEIDARTKNKQCDEFCQLRRSVTSEAKRPKAEQPMIHNEFNVLLRTIHRKPIDAERSKTVGKCTRSENENKYAQIGQINKKFKQRREITLKNRLDLSLQNRSFGQEKSPQPPTNIKSNAHSKIKTPTFPLKSKAKSYGHFGLTCNNSLFQVTESSENLISNLLNPQPEEIFLRKESSDSAKRFYLKLKKRKIGNLWKPLDQEPTLLDSQSVTKQIPSELGIYKIKLPKRNYRHEFLLNIQKIKESYLRIKGSAHKGKIKEQESSKNFQRTPFRNKAKEKKMYEIKYRNAANSDQKYLIRSKTQFFQNRSQWEVFINTPLEPWNTQDSSKMFS